MKAKITVTLRPSPKRKVVNASRHAFGGSKRAARGVGWNFGIAVCRRNCTAAKWHSISRSNVIKCYDAAKNVSVHYRVMEMIATMDVRSLVADAQLGLF